MKKLICVVMSVLFVFLCGCGNKIADVRNEYESLLSKIESADGQMAEKEFANEYAKIFDMIAKGDKSEASEYAKLVNEILHIKDEIGATENDVFRIAKKVAEYFREIAKEDADPGIQSISISDNKIKIAYIGDIAKYRVRKLNADEEILSGESTVSGENLGECRYEIKIIDMEFSKKFLEAYAANEVTKLNNVPSDLKDKVNIRLASADDSTKIIYIGFDKNVEVEEKQAFSIIPSVGTIEISIQ